MEKRKVKPTSLKNPNGIVNMKKCQKSQHKQKAVNQRIQQPKRTNQKGTNQKGINQKRINNINI